jgi:triphosphatase
VTELEAAAGVGLAAEARVGGGLVVGWHARGLLDDEPALRSAWEAFAGTKPFWSQRRG